MKSLKNLKLPTQKAIKLASAISGMEVDYILERNKATGRFIRADARVVARAYAFIVLRHFNKWTLSQIAREFKLTHGAVHGSLSKLSNLYDTDQYQRQKITHLLQNAVKGMKVVNV